MSTVALRRLARVPPLHRTAPVLTPSQGAAGAAAGTALSQSLALVGLLRVLRARTGVPLSPAALLSPGRLRGLVPTLVAYGQAGALVFLRSWGKVGAYAYCARAAARLGPVASAAHLLCFNLGVVLSQLCEAVAVATQTLLARAMGALHAFNTSDAGAAAARRDAWHVLRLGCGVGGVVASLLTGLTAIRPSAAVAGLTSDLAVREACSTIFAPVLACQLCKGLAFPANGVVMGGLDWRFATAGIWAGSGLCLALVHAASPPTLTSIWLGLAVFMGSQSVLSIARVLSRTGPWRVLWRSEG
jgi:Na+-driven multidrug efflux pump